MSDRTSKRQLLLRNGKVIDSSFERFRQVDILVEGTQIKAVDSDLKPDATSNLEEIDVRGKYLIPGLSDFHVHSGVDYEDHLTIYLRFGVLFVRDLGSSADSTAELAARIDAKPTMGPRLISYGELVDGPEPRWPTITVVPQSERDVERHVERCKRIGMAGVKFYHKLPADLLYAGISACHELGLLSSGHLGHVVTVGDAVEHGIDSVEHIATLTRDLVPEGAVREEDGFWHYFSPFDAWDRHVDMKSARVKSLIEKFVKSNTLLVPTLSIYEAIARGDDPQILEDPELALLSEKTLRDWEAAAASRGFSPTHFDIARRGLDKMKEFLLEFYQAGGKLGVGTDTPNPFVIPGASVHGELRLLNDIGMSRGDTIRACCALPAEHLGEPNAWGTLEAGKRANIVALARNPLRDLSATKDISLMVREGLPIRINH